MNLAFAHSKSLCISVTASRPRGDISPKEETKTVNLNLYLTNELTPSIYYAHTQQFTAMRSFITSIHKHIYNLHGTAMRSAPPPAKYYYSNQ